MVGRGTFGTLALSRLTDGVNRHTEEAGRDQCADALNAINDRGVIRRRDGFVTIGTGPCHMLPPSLLAVLTAEWDDPTGETALTRWTERTGSLLNVGYIYVGLDLEDLAGLLGGDANGTFYGSIDGIEWGPLTGTTEHGNGIFTSNVSLEVSYWNGSAWVVVPHYDSTREFLTNGSDTRELTLTRSGKIAWHTATFAANHRDRTMNSITTRWFRLRLLTAAGQITTLSITAAQSVTAPGVRGFVLAPVNGLAPVRINERSTLIVAADRQLRQADPVGGFDQYRIGSDVFATDYASVLGSQFERGAQLGEKADALGPTRELRLIEDEGPGLYGSVTWPQPTRDGTPVGSAGLTYGVANRMRKTITEFYDADTRVNVPYVWTTNQWRGGQIVRDFAVASTTAPASGNFRIHTTAASPSGFPPVSMALSHARIRCTARTGAGPQVGEEGLVMGHHYNSGTGVHTLFVAPAWSATPDANNQFILLAPHCELLVDYDERAWEIRNNPGSGVSAADTPHCLELTSGATNSYAPLLSALPTVIGRWRIGQELRWVMPAARRWSATVDTVTGACILTNGTRLLEYDGRDLRYLRADFSSEVAQAIAGDLPDEAKRGFAGPRQIALSTLRREPPQGRYVVVHHQRLFVAGCPGEPYAVKWSHPGGANNVWPNLFENIVRDEEADPIVGMRALGDRLIVFTPTALHEAVGPADAPAPGFYEFTAIAKGVGFVGHDAVCTVVTQGGAESLVGVSVSGVAGLSSGEPRMVLDDWARLLPDGVNQEALHNAVAASAPQRAWALFAVPSRGSSVNDRILIWDHLRNTWWVWSSPFGVSSLAVEKDETGRETIYFGTSDGFIQVLGDSDTDDGQTITAYAQSPFVDLGEGRMMSPRALVLGVRTLGASADLQMEVDILTDDNQRQVAVDGVVSVDDGYTKWNAGSWNTAPLRYQGQAFKRVQLNIPSGTRPHRIAYRIGGSVRWALKDAALQVSQRARRGRNI